MNELNHPMNMQIRVKKLPSHLQTRWRDRAVILKENIKIATFVVFAYLTLFIHR